MMRCFCVANDFFSLCDGFSREVFFLSRTIILSRNARNSRKRRCCAGLPCGIYIAHKFHKCLSLRDGFLDVLEELGRCAALDFVIWSF